MNDNIVFDRLGLNLFAVQRRVERVLRHFVDSSFSRFIGFRRGLKSLKRTLAHKVDIVLGAFIGLTMYKLYIIGGWLSDWYASQ